VSVKSPQEIPDIVKQAHFQVYASILASTPTRQIAMQTDTV